MTTADEARQIVGKMADEIGVGIIVSDVDEGPPWRISAMLTFGIVQTEVVVEGADEVAAWRELAKAAVSWRQSDAVSLTNTYWGG